MANEKRLIDANALKQKFDEREVEDIELYGCHIIECFQTDDAKEIVDKMPTVDAVEVVLCKNCLFSRYFEESGTRKCRTMQGLYRTVEDDDFCSYGERKDGDGSGTTKD